MDALTFLALAIVVIYIAKCLFTQEEIKTRTLSLAAVLVVFFIFISVGGCVSSPPVAPCVGTALECELSQRIDDLERRAARQRFVDKHNDQARRTCEFAHGSGSVLCQ